MTRAELLSEIRKLTDQLDEEVVTNGVPTLNELEDMYHIKMSTNVWGGEFERCTPWPDNFTVVYTGYEGKRTIQQFENWIKWRLQDDPEDYDDSFDGEISSYYELSGSGGGMNSSNKMAYNLSFRKRQDI